MFVSLTSKWADKISILNEIGLKSTYFEFVGLYILFQEWIFQKMDQVIRQVTRVAQPYNIFNVSKR